jgi:alpha-beta hydrolase superfamily lysophospholipase
MVISNTSKIMAIITSCYLALTFSEKPSTLTQLSRITAGTIHYGPKIVGNEPRTIYSHGLLCNKWTGGGINHCESLIHHPYAFIKGPMISFDYPDWLAPLSTCVAQEEDLEKFDQVCREQTNVILAGCSRGAGAIVNYLGIYKPTNVIAAVIESPFDHSKNVINFLAEQMNIKNPRLIEAISHRVAPYHKQNGIQPINHVADIDHSIPLLFICSKKDRITPFEGCIELYKTSRKAGHRKVHILITDHGDHGFIFSSPTDGASTRNAIHAFYKKYGLPYETEWAEAGNAKFQQSQPSIEELERAFSFKNNRNQPHIG